MENAALTDRKRAYHRDKPFRRIARGQPGGIKVTVLFRRIQDTVFLSHTQPPLVPIFSFSLHTTLAILYVAIDIWEILMFHCVTYIVTKVNCSMEGFLTQTRSMQP